jgi:hypothetical protein
MSGYNPDHVAGPNDRTVTVQQAESVRRMMARRATPAGRAVPLALDVVGALVLSGGSAASVILPTVFI